MSDSYKSLEENIPEDSKKDALISQLQSDLEEYREERFCWFLAIAILSFVCKNTISN